MQSLHYISHCVNETAVPHDDAVEPVELADDNAIFGKV